MKVVVGYVHPGWVHHDFVESLFRLAGRLREDYFGRVAVGSGPLLASARNDVVRTFLASEGTHLLSLDTDVVFDPDVVERLAAHGKPLVSALYHGLDRRSGQSFPVCVEDLELVRADIRKVGLTKVQGVGMGCCLIAREVVESIALKFSDPFVWFQETVREEKAIGEDTEFCMRAAEVGFDTYLDTDLIVGHAKTVLV